MSDYLSIDTERARSAAHHLRAMSSSGIDVATTVRTAFALADLADPCGPRLLEVAEALDDLATVLVERSDAADAGGLLPYRATSVSLPIIIESLVDYAPPSAAELFPVIGPASTRNEPSESPASSSHERVDGDDDCDDGSGWLAPLLSPIIDQPVLSPVDQWRGTWEHIGEGWETLSDTVSSASGAIDDRLSDIDWSSLERFGERVQEASSDPSVLAATALIPMAISLEVASHYSILGTDVYGLGVAYSRAGDGKRRVGFSVPTSVPREVSLPIPSFTLTPTDTVPQSGFSVNGQACDMVCVGASVDEELDVHPNVGIGLPGGGVDSRYTYWYEPGGD